MRSILPIGFLVLYVVTFTNAQGDKIVFRDEDDAEKPLTDEEWAFAQYRSVSHAAVSKSTNSFGLKCFEQVANKNRGNLIFSPISTSLILSMMSYGANKAVRKEMQNVLEFPKNPTVAGVGLRSVVGDLAEYRAANVEVLNAVFLNYDVSPKPAFMDIVHNVFLSAIYTIDMTNPTIASTTVNNWSEVNTNGRIKDIVDPDKFGADKKLLLLNAVSFKGNWVHQFDPKSTTPQNFYLDDFNTRIVPIMFVNGEFRNGRLPALDSRFIELPYKSVDGQHSVSMFVVLPNTRTGLAKLEDNLAALRVEDLFEQGRVHEVDVFLPKFKIESTIELAEPLMNMGIKSAFVEGSFSDMFDYSNLAISKIVQKAVIEVDELGSEAAAVTEVEYANKMATPYFVADHPFVAIIATTGPNPLVLFTLRYTGQ